ncbi:hypothetical protein [Sphingobium aquiterrae]|uniref:hypothetical protein n=1 Tax=Sphingobium aquiterrae TaxID=2038656 RepID=UPI003018EFF4
MHNMAMTVSPIERAARAMYDVAKPDWDWNDPSTESLRQTYREKVQAVLTAIHEPGEEAVEAGMEIVKNVHPGMSEAGYRDDTMGIWHMMIDAILNEAQ